MLRIDKIVDSSAGSSSADERPAWPTSTMARSLSDGLLGGTAIVHFGAIIVAKDGDAHARSAGVLGVVQLLVG